MLGSTTSRSTLANKLMDCKTCNKCEAMWIEGQHYWRSGVKGNELDLASLVCNNLKPGEDSECINPQRGQTGGDTWEYRRGFIDGAMKEYERTMNKED